MRTIKELVDKNAIQIEQSLRDRLYKDGTYSDGKKIKTYKAAGSFVYSTVTVNFKRMQGEPSDRVTLKDTGELYESFDTQAGSDDFVIDYDDDKPNGNISDNIPDMGEAIKLGEIGLNKLRESIKTDLQDDFKNEAREAILYAIR